MLMLLGLAMSAGGSVRPAWQYQWRTWLPDKWRRLASCETHLRWDWHSRGRYDYVSAFGIEAGNYAADARYAGEPQWSDDPGRRPTPWEQYRTALAHYRLHYGFDGWGCKGA